MGLYGLLHIVNIGFISVIFLIHLRFGKRELAANRMFSIFLASLAYASFALLLFTTRWILEVPHFARTGSLVLYLVYPAAYLYVKKILKQEGWKRSDLLHLIPAFIYLVDFTPYYLSSGAEKKIQLLSDFESNNLYIVRKSWLFPDHFHFLFRSVLALMYSLFMSKLWVDNFYLNENDEFRRENRSLMQWTFLLTLTLILAIIPSFVVFLFEIPIDLGKMLNSSIYFTTIFFAIFLFFKPEILYGVRGLWVAPDLSVNAGEVSPPSEETADSDEGEPAEQPRKLYIREEVVVRLGEGVERFMEEGKPYLRSSFSINELSAAVGFPVHQISAYLNTHLGMNFNEYINKHRIEHLLTGLQKNPEWKQFTLEALAGKVGFNNRYTFLNAFKRVTGETPSAYLRTMTDRSVSES
jgi:AraC-like DNA-binding protein